MERGRPCWFVRLVGPSADLERDHVLEVVQGDGRVVVELAVHGGGPREPSLIVWRKPTRDVIAWGDPAQA